MSMTLETPDAAAAAPEACGVCKQEEVIFLHCTKCGKALCRECVLDCELNSRLCSQCNPPKAPSRRGRFRR